MRTKKTKNQKPRIKKLLILFLFFILFHIYASPESKFETPDIIQKNVTYKNEEIEKKIIKKKNEINQLISAQLFKKAVIQIAQLKKLNAELSSSIHIKKELEATNILEKTLYKKWSVYLENQAKAASVNKKWDDSLTYARESIKKLKTHNISSPQAVVLNDEIIKKAKHGLSKEILNETTSIANIIPDHNQEQDDIQKYFTLAETYSKAEEYEKARDMLEKIQILEPYNYKAMYELKQIYQKITSTGTKRKYMQMREKLAQTEWGYVPAIKSQMHKKNIIPIIEKENDSSNLKKKLEQIIIPKVEFDKTSLSSVVKYIRMESKVYDNIDNLGINIDLRPENQEIENIEITMHLTNIPLDELIKLICSYADLNYKIKKHSIIISDAKIDTMVLKYISIKSDIINSIASINNFNLHSGNTVSSSDMEKRFTKQETSLMPVNIKNEMLKTYFIERGVPFPEESTISWDMASSTLITKNTQENIKILMNLLQDIDINMPLVLIEVKLVELTYNKDKGLAFNWRINLEGTDWNFNQITQSEGIDGNDFLNNTGDLLNLLEFSQDPINIGNAIGALDFLVYAIEQTNMGETLSAPKIITKSGSTAEFQMVQKNYYATSWTVTDPEVVYETVQIAPPTPEFEEMSMGIVLQVTPVVSPNHKTVFIDIYPVVKEFLKYDDTFVYSVQAIETDTGTDTPLGVNRKLLMPEILKRDIKSKLKINDGETVVLGGMLKDKTTTVMDKYPIFGDIPLVGRFFRSEYEEVEQINLLIFVTVKLVNPDGTLVHKPKPSGIFEFKNI
jgi:Flp pilus assembly secretin CpaC/tetratricopeptide (TPR) repeat protein